MLMLKKIASKTQKGTDFLGDWTMIVVTDKLKR